MSISTWVRCKLWLTTVGFLECRLTLPKFYITDHEEANRLTKPLEKLQKAHALVWIMIKPEQSEDGLKSSRTTLESKNFFSTLEYGAVPKTATDLFLPLIQQLQEEWNAVYGAAEQHLDDRARITSLIEDAS